MHTYNDGPVEASRELSSNLHEICNRLLQLALDVHGQSERLRRKNEQMIHTPGPEHAKTSMGVGEKASSAERIPLVSELNTLLIQLEHEVDVLQAYVSVTETI